MIGNIQIHGHAIVSADHMIATPEGTYPKALFNAADQKNFQNALDQAVVTILGRLGHESDPNPRLRNRLVVSTRAKGLERRPDGWWWNPAQVTISEALNTVAHGGGIAAVVGGQRVFDMFLDAGYDEFHLARSERVTIPGGLAVFAESQDGRTPEHVLAGHGMVPGATTVLDGANHVTLVVWRRGGA